jgi:predicted DNA-binding protein
MQTPLNTRISVELAKTFEQYVKETGNTKAGTVEVALRRYLEEQGYKIEKDE